MTDDATETDETTTPRCRTWTTDLALDAVAWGRAPGDRINYRIVCADGFKVSVQASSHHYCDDSHPSGGAPYWSFPTRQIEWPFISFELGNWGGDGGDLTPELEQAAEDGAGVCGWAERDQVAALLKMHGGAIGFEEQR